MRRCEQCGHVAKVSDQFCENCGAVLPYETTEANDPAPAAEQQSYQAPEQPASIPQQQTPFQQPEQPSGGLFGDYTPPAPTTKQEFLNLPENEKYYKSCRTSAIICYICAGATFILAVLVMGSAASLLDVGILIGLGLGIHLKQSKVCAIILLIYSIINIIYMLAAAGTFGGWLVLIAGISAVASTVNADKAWKQYQQDPSAAQTSFTAQPYPQQAPAQNMSEQGEAGENEWKCPKCGRINQNYVGTCGCGCTKAEAKQQ